MSRRWFPEEGDLVSISGNYMYERCLAIKCIYGVVIRESKGSNFKGVWWDVFLSGTVESINIQSITPMWDKEGVCLMMTCRSDK